MNSKKLNLIALGLALALAGAGCKHKGNVPVTKLPGGPNAGLTGGGPEIGGGGTFQPTPGPTPVGGGELPAFNPDDMNQDRTALAPDMVYFDFDSATIKASQQPKLQAVAGALQSDPSAKLLIEGNCDERGTEEYNRALGERRALAAREALAKLSVDAARIATRSYGEDRPADPGHAAAAWAKNRRDEFVLLHAK